LLAVDWATVTSTAITGAVGIAGVVGGVITARIAGSSARKSAQLNITAEADRARLAEKRRIYARGVGALDTAMLAKGDVRIVQVRADSGDAEALAKLDDYRAKENATLRDALEAASELELIAPRPAVELVRNALVGVSDRDVYAGHREKLVEALRDDLGKEADRAHRPT
jgi:hypothetical protein